METATWVLLLFYALIILYLVVNGAKKTRSISDYAVGSVVFSPWFVGLSLAASMTSAATFVINPGFIAYYGISAAISYGVVLPGAAMFSLAILTKGFRRHGTLTKALTMAQWMGSRYQNQGFSLFFAFLSLLLITFIVLIVVGLSMVISKSTGISTVAIMIGLVVFVFGYMMFGGANSMVYTNAVQAMIMISVAFILLGSGYEHFRDGVNGFLEKLGSIDKNLIEPYNSNSFLFRDFFEIYLAQIVIGFAIVCQPHIITKSLLLKSDSDVNKYLWTGITVQTLFFLVVVAGLYARISFPDLTFNGVPLRLDGVMSAYVVQEFPVWIGLFVILGLISAGISTLEGLIESVSTTLTADVIKPLGIRFLNLNVEWFHTIEVRVNRFVIAGIALVTAVLSFWQIISPNLSVGIFAQNGVYAYFSAALIPILAGLFVPAVPVRVPVIASVTAVVVHFSMFYGNIPVPGTAATGANPGVAATIAILASLVAGMVVWLLPIKKMTGVLK